MHAQLWVQVATFIAGFAAFGLGLVGITRSLRLQKLLMAKQEQGLDLRATKADPQVRAAMQGLRAPLIWATVLAVCSVALPSLAGLVLS
ncbi:MULTISPECIES: hypothetical protein [Pseudoxanthomonas]|jgi:hypothetical protein|uniref:Uncharacterized protein n=1 Tax=Pseudoxanthomonas winnipegensis TaxID=2480810 RepID=A0A4Q8L741_9GAMM|nr:MULTISPECIES: hypothetical protein [Pseudoxanthomonas]PZP63033.1 MAG: hypothetical protein DI597_03025 [Pseudoxanthomonas spadix]TAA23652.1 hypothetical protein EA660_13560 [Pseudoxanthomonas winnipegensis]TMN25870.1 hypothetical protein FF950_01005 [Pseudoxanthomonas sp. X-1]UAY72867.1 hypothetical protein LAJ50_10010 [Pseudoxanthomonas sp. X-1]